MKRLVSRILVVLLATASSAAKAQTPAALTTLDSVVLERTACFGTCPVYRLALFRSGKVEFTSRNRSDSAAARYDSVPPATVAALLPAAARLGVFELPAVIATSPALCGGLATDHPTAIVSLYGAEGVRGIVDYLGCSLRRGHSMATGLGGLRAFETLIDSVAYAKRWVRPNRSR